MVGRAKVISLVPSMTETLLAWGLKPAACTRFCEQPTLHHVGGTKDPDLEAIVALRPDLVIVDEEENRREDHDRLVERGLEVWVLSVRSVADVAAQLEPLAAYLGVDWTMATLPAPVPIELTAFIPIWKNPWMALGVPTYGASLVEHLGIASVFLVDGPYPATSLDDARLRRPDLVIAPSEPYPFGERHRTELQTVAPTVFVDGRDLVWWGARTADALKRLERVLNH